MIRGIWSGARWVLAGAIVVFAGCEVMEEVARTLPVILAPTPVDSGTAQRTRRAGPQPRRRAAAIRLSDGSGRAGGSVTVEARLETGGANVAGAQNDIVFGDGLSIAARGNRPDCSVNPSINKGATAFAFTPSGCRGTACQGVRVIVFSMTNLSAIPDGSVLYTCRVAISSGARAGRHTLALRGVSLSTATGQEVPAQEIGATITVTR